MRLRTHLILVALATLLPLAILAGIVGWLLVQEQRETFRRGAEERTLALLTAVDAELRGAIATIQVLSQSESLANGDLARFRATAQRVLAAHPEWSNINVARPDGGRLLDLLLPPGAPLPPVQRSEPSFERALRTREAVVGDLAVGPVSKRWNYTVRMPVAQDGAVAYVLSAVIEPQSMARLVAEQNLPEGWVGVVLDANHRIVARTLEPQASLGRLASQSLQDALADAPHGWFRGSTLEGTVVYTPYRRSELTGWTFAMGIPAATVDAAAWRAAGLLALALSSALALALVFARIVGQRIAAPIASLASATDAIGRGERVAVPQTAAIDEVGRFARTLQDALNALREREARLQAYREDLDRAQAVAHVGSWRLDVRRNALTWSDESYRIAGIPIGTPLGYESFLALVHPDDRDHVDRQWQAALRGEPYDIEHRLIVDGKLRWARQQARLEFDAEGRLIGCYGAFHDITDRKRTEQTLLDTEARLVADLSAQTRLHELSARLVPHGDLMPLLQEILAAAAHLSGTDKGSIQFHDAATGKLRIGVHQGLGQRFIEHFADDGWAATCGDAASRIERVIVEDVARLEQFRGTIELEIVLGDDIRSIQSTPLISRDGRLLGMLNNHYRAPGRPDDASLRHIDLLARQAADLIERHQAEEALRKANRHKDEFLAMLSHELRNPLAALTSAARLLELVPPASEQAAKARGVIERQTRHMSRLVGDLLDISRVAMGKLVLQRERFDAAEAISSVVHAWRTSGRLDGHEVSLAAESVWVEGDRARIEQIASNLLDNALKFTPPGKSVTVDLRREDGGAVLRVADQGRGLAAEDCSRIFDLFTQGDTPDRTGGGLGIGLALVKRLAERHGGTVSATSDGPGHGAIFTVRLPAVEPPPLLVPRAAPAAGDARAMAGLP